MNERNDNNLEPQQRTAQDAVRSLPRVQADAGFRSRLKDEFVSGDIARQVEVVEIPRRRPAVRWLAAGVALAAVLALALIGMNRLPGPQLLASHGQGSVVIDGEPHYRKFADSSQILIVVAGGTAGKFSGVLGGWLSGAKGSQIVSYPVRF